MEDIKTSSSIRSFTHLDAWKVGHQFVLMIYAIARHFPEEEQFGLASQMRRAAVSITSNIAEGFSRASTKDKQRFYRTALSSLTELQNQLLIMKDVHYATQEDFQKTAAQSVRVSKLINGLIRSAPGKL